MMNVILVILKVIMIIIGIIIIICNDNSLMPAVLMPTLLPAILLSTWSKLHKNKLFSDFAP